MATPEIHASEILATFEARRERLVEDVSALARLEAPTGDAGRIRAFVAEYRRRLEAAGIRCREIDGPKGPHLLGERGGEEPALVLVGHSDTVWPAGEAVRRPPSVREGRLEGPGVYDMRAGLALIAWSLELLRERAIECRRRLLVFISADEETGSRSARGAMESALPASATALLPEPPCPDGSLKIARKGVGIFDLEVQGLEAHAGVHPEKGVSAIAEIARLILEVEGWRDPAAGILVNVGTIQGGTATNVVPARARCGIDVRFDRLEDGDAMARRLSELRPSRPEARISVSGGVEFPPMVPTARSRRLGRIAGEIARSELGLEISMGSSGGGSDGCHLAARGLTVLDGLGVDGGGAHALDEHILVDRIPLRAALFTRLVLELDRFPEA